MYHRLMDCRGCDLLYADHLYEETVLEKNYDEAKYDSSEESGYAAKTYAKFLPLIIKKIKKHESALDIGAGDGVFLEKLLEAGFKQVTGVEPSLAPVRCSKKHISPLIKKKMFKASDFSPESFDLITCFQTLEHLSQPSEICRGIYTLLNDGAAIFVVCHDRRSLSAKLLGMKSPIFDIEHFQLFSKKSLKRLLQSCGFVDITVEGIFNSYPMHYWLKLFPMPPNVKRILMESSKTTKIGYLPITLPAGNIAAVGFKKTHE